MGQGVCHPAAVADHIQPLVYGLKMLVQLYLHIVEFHFYAIEEGIVVRRARRDLIQRVHHLDDAVQDTLRKNEA